MANLEIIDDCNTGAEAIARRKRSIEYWRNLKGWVQPKPRAALVRFFAVEEEKPKPLEEERHRDPRLIEARSNGGDVGKLINLLDFNSWGSIEVYMAMRGKDDSYISKKSIMLATCKYFNVDLIQLFSVRRDKEVVDPRHVGYYLCKKLTPSSYPEIGRLMYRDHTTILSGVRRVKRILSNPTTKRHFEIVEAVNAIERVVLGS